MLLNFYRILEEITSSKTPTCDKFVKKNLEQIQNFILSTAQNVAATSRGVIFFIKYSSPGLGFIIYMHYKTVGTIYFLNTHFYIKFRFFFLNYFCNTWKFSKTVMYTFKDKIKLFFGSTP